MLLALPISPIVPTIALDWWFVGSLREAMSITPFADRSSSAPMLEQLLIYLSALPDSRDIESLLRLTLQAALGLTGAGSGAAVASGELQARVSAGPDEEEIWPMLLACLPPAPATGDSPAAVEPALFRAGPLLVCALNADGHLHGLVAVSGAARRQGLEDSLHIVSRAAGSML